MDSLRGQLIIASPLLQDPNFDRPVVLTGAQRPLAALRTDARRNLADADLTKAVEARMKMPGTHGYPQTRYGRA